MFRMTWVLVLIASAARAQVVSTRCQTASVAVPYDANGARLLVACDASFPDDVLWNLDRSDQRTGNLDGAFRSVVDGKGSVIYVVDSGVLAAHDEFMTPAGSKVIAGIDVLDSRLPCDVPNWALEPCATTTVGAAIDGHGTAVASAAAGNRVGVAPGASIVAVRAFTAVAGLSAPALLRALDAIIAHAWASTTPPFETGIITMSIGLNDFLMPAEVETKIRQMVEGVDREGRPDPRGKRFFFAFFGGNVDLHQCDAFGSPVVAPTLLAASIEGAMAVGGLARPNEVWSNSCHGPGIEVYAPAAGVLVASFTGHDHYRPAAYSSGTSYAAPYVAGIAARLLQQNPHLTPAELESIIVSTAARSSEGAPVAVFVDERAGRRRAVGR